MILPSTLLRTSLRKHALSNQRLRFLFCLMTLVILSVSLQCQTISEQASSYRLQAGDSFTVLYRLTPEYNQTVVIQPNGDVMLQLIGTLSVGHLTLADATRLIHDRASSRLKTPDISLELKDYEKPHFSVLGEVTAPGRYELRGTLTVEDGLALAGGLRLAAKHNNILLIRPINSEFGKTKLIDFRTLEKQKNNAEVRMLPGLEAGDIIIVPTSKLSKVERYVKIINTGIYYNPASQ